jgi:hypothetical protein
MLWRVPGNFSACPCVKTVLCLWYHHNIIQRLKWYALFINRKNEIVLYRQWFVTYVEAKIYIVVLLYKSLVEVSFKADKTALCMKVKKNMDCPGELVIQLYSNSNKFYLKSARHKQYRIQVNYIHCTWSKSLASPSAGFIYIGSIGWSLGPQNLVGLRPRCITFLTLLLDLHTYAVITYCTF